MFHRQHFSWKRTVDYYVSELGISAFILSKHGRQQQQQQQQQQQHKDDKGEEEPMGEDDLCQLSTGMEFLTLFTCGLLDQTTTTTTTTERV